MYKIEVYPKQVNIEKIVQLNEGQNGLYLVGKLLHIKSDNFVRISNLVQYIRSEKLSYSLYKYESLNFLTSEILSSSKDYL